MPIFTVGKQRVVAGMTWEFVYQKRSRELRVVAKSANASHFAALPGKSGVLLGTTTIREEKSPVSLALLLLPVLRKHGENVTAVFELAEGEYWFVAITGNALAVLSDITGTRNTVLAAIDTFNTFNGISPVCIAPTDFFTAQEAEPLTLSAALKAVTFKQKFAARLHPVSTHKTNTRIALTAGVCFAAWLGWQHWEQVQADRQTARDRQAYLDAKQSQWAKDHQVIKPWVSQPLPADFLTEYSAVWKKLRLSISGWRIASVECGNDSDHHPVLLARYSRQRNSGTVGDFTKRVQTLYHVTPVFDIPGSASTGQFVLPVTLLSVTERDNTPLLPAREALINFTSYIQWLQATVSIQKTSPVNDIQKLPWQVYHFQFKTDNPPEHLFMRQFPGVRLSRITFSLSQARMHYTLQGEMYAR